jgi:hypothetical protein
LINEVVNNELQSCLGTKHASCHKKQHTLTSAWAMASRKTHFSMYPQDDAHAWHLPHVAALAIASKYADTQTSAFARACEEAYTLAVASPARTQLAVTEATAAAYADAVALATDSAEPVPSQANAAALAAAHATRGQVSTQYFPLGQPKHKA